MNRLYIIIIAILCFTAVAIAGDIVKHYDEHHKITGSDILNGTMMIRPAIMTKRIIEPDIPRNIKTKKPCLTSPGTARDIKNEMETVQFFDV